MTDTGMISRHEDSLERELNVIFFLWKHRGEP